MKILHYLDAIFMRLSIIPGLGFLHEYVHELEVQKGKREQMANTYRGYARSLRDAGEAAKHGGHHGGHDEHGKHDEAKGHGKQAKRGRRGAPPARPGTGGHAARKAPEKEDSDSDVDFYEDDDFESYLQH